MARKLSAQLYRPVARSAPPRPQPMDSIELPRDRSAGLVHCEFAPEPRPPSEFVNRVHGTDLHRRPSALIRRWHLGEGPIEGAYSELQGLCIHIRRPTVPLFWVPHDGITDPESLEISVGVAEPQFSHRTSIDNAG